VDAGIARTIARIRSDKKGIVSLAIANTGVEAGVGYKPRDWFDIGGYARKSWTRPGWEVGGRVNVHF
jgi:hypothetical protein